MTACHGRRLCYVGELLVTLVLLLVAALVGLQDSRTPPCGGIRSFEDGRTPASVVHVAISGSDADGDGSASRPYATLGRAARKIAPGAAIRIHAGAYPAGKGGGTFLAGITGTATAPIWIGGAPGEPPPVLEGGGQGLHLSKPRYVVIHDLEVRGAAHNGINADDGGDRANREAAGFVVFRNLHIHDIGGAGNQDGLKLSGLSDYWVLDSRFSRCGGGHAGSGIDQVGCHRGIIARSVFEHMSGNAVQVKGGSEDVEIRACRMVDAGSRALNVGGSTGFEYFRPPLSKDRPNFEARNVRVIANVIVGSDAALAFVGCVGCLAAHNTIVDPKRWVLRVLQETTTNADYAFGPSADCRFVNNLVYFDRGRLAAFANVGPGTDAGSFRFANNFWYAHDDSSRSAPTGLPAPESGRIVGRDPQFVDAAAGNFAIRRSSPAVRAGATLKGIEADFAGRCYAAPPSIGAFEVGR